MKNCPVPPKANREEPVEVSWKQADIAEIERRVRVYAEGGRGTRYGTLDSHIVVRIRRGLVVLRRREMGEASCDDVLSFMVPCHVK